MDIFLVANQKYFDRAKALVSSILKYRPNDNIIANLVNVKDPHSLAINKRIKVIDDGVPGLTRRQERFYCGHKRVELLYNHIKPYGRILLYMDADALIRDHLNDLAYLIEENEIVIKRRKTRIHYKKVMSGVCGFYSSPNSKKFIKRWLELLTKMDEETPGWTNDQISLHQTLVEFEKNGALGKLPSKFIDVRFGEESPIWVGRGSLKCRTRYKELYQYHLERFNSLYKKR